LQDGDAGDGAVEVLGEEVPEDFGPDVAGEGGGDLVCCVLALVHSISHSTLELGLVVEMVVVVVLTRSSRKDNQARPVVLDQLSHLRKLHSLVLKERIRAVNRARGRVRKKKEEAKKVATTGALDEQLVELMDRRQGSKRGFCYTNALRRIALDNRE
jgi:hypothetical protein